jgi:fructose-specific PTS system IIA-like component
MRERALDIQGICLELLESIAPEKAFSAIELNEPSLLLAENLLPQQLLAVDRNCLRGLVLESAGTTSHTVLLARSLGIPALASCKIHNQRERDPHGQESSNGVNASAAILDANRGFLILNPSPEVQKFYDHETQLAEKRAATMSRCAAQPAVTADGHSIEVASNIAAAEEAVAAFQNGADGIGVFRTEMLFMTQEHALSEEEQFQIYAATARAAKGKPVILRTIDIGGDKPLPFLKLPTEANPFLGYRGVRIYHEHQELLQTQLRAMLRASAFGRVQIMVPMVSRSEEVLWFKTQLEQVKEELKARNIPMADSVPLGIMVEIPSIAFMLDQLCRELDFFSLGTNDLSQYFFAADRGNVKVAGLSSVTHPAFLRFLHQIVATIRNHGKWIGICGDMAADLRNLPLLLGLELNELSVPPADVPIIKERIAGLSLAECRRLFAQALTCDSSAEVESLLDRAASHASRNLLDHELILLRHDVANKEDAIRELVDALYINGRTDDPDQLEDALWSREAAYSTSMVPGFAVPHCKSDAVSAPSLAVLKLQKPVTWGTEVPVQMVILLAARESDSSNAHLQTFSRLARKLMDEDFRNRLLQAENEDALLFALNSITQQQSA